MTGYWDVEVMANRQSQSFFAMQADYGMGFSSKVVIAHLIATLHELNAPQNLVDQIDAIAESTRNDVLNR